MSFGGGGGGDPKGVKSEINVTPLVDVVLVLLIIFMVVTPLLQRGVNVMLPEAQNVVEPKGGDPILVGVKPDGTVWLESDEVAKDKLAGELRAMLERRPLGTKVVIKGDVALDYAKVRDVIIAIQEAGAEGVALAAAQQKKEP